MPRFLKLFLDTVMTQLSAAHYSWQWGCFLFSLVECVLAFGHFAQGDVSIKKPSHAEAAKLWGYGSLFRLLLSMHVSQYNGRRTKYYKYRPTVVFASNRVIKHSRLVLLTLQQLHMVSHSTWISWLNKGQHFLLYMFMKYTTSKCHIPSVC